MSKTIDVAASTDVREKALYTTQTQGRKLVLTRIDGRAYALENRCPHLGLPLTRGKLDGTALQCPWHGSRFDVCSGQNLDWVNSLLGLPMPRWSHGMLAMGKQPQAVRTFPTTEEDGRVSVELSADG